MTRLTRVSKRLIKEIKFNTVAALLADTITAGQPLPTSVSSTVTGLYVGEELLHLAGPY